MGFFKIIIKFWWYEEKIIFGLQKSYEDNWVNGSIFAVITPLLIEINLNLVNMKIFLEEIYLHLGFSSCGKGTKTLAINFVFLKSKSLWVLRDENFYELNFFSPKIYVTEDKKRLIKSALLINYLKSWRFINIHCSIKSHTTHLKILMSRRNSFNLIWLLNFIHKWMSLFSKTADIELFSSSIKWKCLLIFIHTQLSY